MLLRCTMASIAIECSSTRLDASYSLNLQQPGTIDLNRTGTPLFTLSNENNRPVFVSPSSIVTSTSLVSPLDGRVSPEFGRVVSRRSDLRSEVKQATISVLPYMPQRLAQIITSGYYTFATSRSLTRGFDGGTFGDTALREWSSGFMPQHHVRLQLGYRIRANYDALIAAIKDHVLASGEVIGLGQVAPAEGSQKSP